MLPYARRLRGLRNAKSRVRSDVYETVAPGFSSPSGPAGAPCYSRRRMSGAPVVTVAELDRRLRQAVEGATGDFWVEGEVTSLKRAPSGHVYFTLRDEREDAVIDCVMYRFDAQRAQKHLADGARLQVWGRATVWAPRGRLQLVGSFARPAGRGALLEALEALKKKLQAEGLFAQERKRPLPPDPRVLGVVTSAHGAALHDVRTVAFRRGRVILVLSPAVVQGELAPQSIVAALDRIEKDRRVEVVIIGRGGGSNEDLMAFNDERVVRRVARMRVPTVSAIGHEIDTTLTDLVADVRAATPSQAAELVVPDFRQRQDQVKLLTRRLVRATRARVLEDRTLLHRLSTRLGDPRFVISQQQQELDELCRRAERAMQRRMTVAQNGARGLARRLAARHPRLVIANSRLVLGPLQARLVTAMRLLFKAAAARLDGQRGRLGALSPYAVLGRGYAIAMTEDGKVITRASSVQVGEQVQVKLQRGLLRTEVLDFDEGARDQD